MFVMTSNVYKEIGHVFKMRDACDDAFWASLVTAVAKHVDFRRLDDADVDNIKEMVEYVYDRSEALSKPFALQTRRMRDGRAEIL